MVASRFKPASEDSNGCGLKVSSSAALSFIAKDRIAKERNFKSWGAMFGAVIEHSS